MAGEKQEERELVYWFDFIRLGLVLGSWASSDLLTNLKTLLLPKKDARGLCVTVFAQNTQTIWPAFLQNLLYSLFVCGEKTIVTVPQCWPQFVCTPGSAGACVCAGNCMGVCHGAVMLSRGKQSTLRVQMERAGGPSALFAYQQMFIITLDLCVVAPALWEKCSMSG